MTAKPEPPTDTITILAREIGELRRDMTQRYDDFAAVIVALIAQHGDPTHVTVDRAAALRGESVKTIRRRIAAGELTLDESGIPVAQIYPRWFPRVSA